MKEKALTLSVVIGILLVLAGFWLFMVNRLPPTSGNINSSGRQVVNALNKAAGSSKTSPILIRGVPARIQIPDLAIDLKIVPGYYNSSNASWTLSLSNAQYAAMLGPTSNQSGETFIYAHNRPGVFESLPQIAPGMQAILTTSNGHTFKYSYQSSVVVQPTDTQVLAYKGKPIMVAQTCSGAWYQNRQLFIFQLLEAA